MIYKCKLKEYLKSAGLRQEDLALAIGTSRQTILSICNEKSIPNVVTALAIAHELQISTEELFQIEGYIEERLTKDKHPLS